MGILDKIKNALFEVEYVEVEESPKKEKKVKEKREKREDRPIAKKIVLPGRREEKIEELHEEELKDEDFEIRPKDETPKEEKPREEFKIMEDKDFTVDEEVEAPEILQVYDEHEDVLDGKHVNEEVEYLEERKLYPERKPTVDAYKAPVSHESKAYGMDHSYNVSVHPYGTYEKKEEKTYFRPSPIISPIYGILDKNYKKEDVKEKRDVHISSSYSRNSLNVDDIRNKAYGDKKKEEEKEEKKEVPAKFDVDEEEDNLLVDLSDRAKPEVKELTMGDALEYFQDLGLEYNVDYVDVSKEKATQKKIEEEKEEDSVEKDIENATADLDPVVEEVQEQNEEVVEEKQEPPKVEEKKAAEEDNDNLFDLIDSMYQDKD